MRKSVISIVSVAIVSLIFLSVMSTLYLSHLPTKRDLRSLEVHIRRSHGLYLSVSIPIEVTFTNPDDDAVRGLKVRCGVRRDLEKKPAAVDVHLRRIAESVLAHPDWRLHTRQVTVEHVGRIKRSLTMNRPKDADKPTPKS